MMAAPYLVSHAQTAAGVTHGNTTENLRDGKETSTLGGKGTNEGHTKRDGGVEETTGNSEKDPGVDG
jgi:hypothetical protein